jgi:hypothetical protein
MSEYPAAYREDQPDIIDQAADQLSFAPEYFGVSTGVTPEEAQQAAVKFEAWIEAIQRERSDEVQTYDAGPRYPSPEEMFRGVKTDENPYPTRFIIRGRDFDDGSALTVTLVSRDEAIDDSGDELRGATAGVIVNLYDSPRIQARKLIYRVDGDPAVLRREDNRVTVGGMVYGPPTAEELARQEAAGMNNQLCGPNELAGLIYLFDHEELPKTKDFFTHEFEQR